MKPTVFCSCLVVLAGSHLMGADLRTGASLAEVQAELGRPRGQADIGGRQILYYERGEVELQNGRLVRTALRTEEEHAILVAREERLSDEREARRVRLLEEGTALRDAKLADDAFRKDMSAAYQVAFWEDFARRYPEVPVAEHLAVARVRAREQVIEDLRRKEEEAARAAEAEERLAAAEPRGLYAGRYYSRYGRRHYHPHGLGPLTYTFFDSPLPPYVTPSGNPAGDLRGPVVTPLVPGSGIGNERNRSGRWNHNNRRFDRR